MHFQSTIASLISRSGKPVLKKNIKQAAAEAEKRSPCLLLCRLIRRLLHSSSVHRRAPSGQQRYACPLPKYILFQCFYCRSHIEYRVSRYFPDIPVLGKLTNNFQLNQAFERFEVLFSRISHNSGNPGPYSTLTYYVNLTRLHKIALEFLVF